MTAAVAGSEQMIVATTDPTITLSIIIPCRDRQEMMTGLLAQLRDQIAARCDIQVIVVDDGSSPPLQVQSAPWLTLLRHERSLGAPAGRELGFRHALGRFIHFHDSDDPFGHDWIAATISTIGSNPPPDIVVTSRLVVSPGRETSFWPVARLSAVAKTPERLLAYQRFINRIGPLGGVVFSRKCAQAIRFHRAAASQDWLMYDDALSVAATIIFDSKNYFVFNKTQTIRISNNARSRVEGYVFAARVRFKSRRLRRFAARIYCAHGADDLAPVVNVRHRWFKRFACEILARYPKLAGK